MLPQAWFFGDAARQVRLPEFPAAVKRSIFWFKTFDSEDPADREQMVVKWLEGMERKGEPVIWAWLVNVIKKHDILTCSLATGMVVALYGVADVFGTRLAKAG
jgi:hypothetical protein